MTADRPYPKITVTAKAAKSIRGGHPWVFEEEVTGIQEPCASGDIADVYTEKGRWLGSGFFNEASKLRVRLISRNANDRFDEAFWRRRLRYALDYRRAVMGDDFSHCCRLIFGEADQFPGLTVDRFGPVLTAQVLCLGIERRKAMLFSALAELLREDGEPIDAIYERSDGPLRSKEGMEPYKGFFAGDGLRTDLGGHVEICENGIFYDVDYASGQKTGFFLDQKYNRLAVAKLAAGRRVLDCFTHTGSFGLNAAKHGAEHVTCVDASREALSLAKENAVRNGLDGKMDFVRSDVFSLLTEMTEQSRRGEYDLIILDPPAFTKSSATVSGAVRGYKEINTRAMRLLPRGGYLATCSCSHFMTDERFRAMLAESARDAQVSLRQIEQRRQSPDHPILWGVPETEYLKFYIFQVI